MKKKSDLRLTKSRKDISNPPKRFDYAVVELPMGPGDHYQHSYTSPYWRNICWCNIRVCIQGFAVIFNFLDEGLQHSNNCAALAVSIVSFDITRVIVEILESSFAEERLLMRFEAIKVSIPCNDPRVGAGFKGLRRCHAVAYSTSRDFDEGVRHAL